MRISQKSEKVPVVLEKKHPLAIRWFHWLNFPLLAVMIWSGFLIYWANDIYGVRILGKEYVRFMPERIFTGNKAVTETEKPGIDPYAPPAPSWWPEAWSRQGDPADSESPRQLYQVSNRLWTGMAWHFLFMWFFTINGLLYVLYTAFSGQWRYLVPGKGTLKHALQTILHDLHLRKQPPIRQKFNGAQQIAYCMIVLMGVGSVLTGWAIYKPSQLGWLTGFLGGYGSARFIHFWLMMGYLGFFLIHVLQVIRAGWNNFRAMVTGYELAPAEGGTDHA